jgi:sodium pump decarboxylase gamma subunit
MHDVGENLAFGVQLTITGVTVVFVALVTVALVMIVLRRLDQPEETKKQKAAARAPAAASSTPAPVSDELSPEVMVAIAAAVEVALRRKVHIQRIRYRTFPSEAGWSRQGRMSIMASHAPKKVQ